MKRFQHHKDKGELKKGRGNSQKRKPDKKDKRGEDHETTRTSSPVEYKPK
jgi:hypothetical protein